MSIQNTAFLHVRRASLSNSLLSVLFILAVCAGSAIAQSADRNSPTILTSAEISGNAVASNSEYFYTFTAGPGELLVTVEVTSNDFSTAFIVDLFDASNNGLGNATAIATNQRTEVGTRAIRLARRQSVLMRLRFDGNAARYNVQLGGAMEFGEEPLRRSGTSPRTRAAVSSRNSPSMMQAAHGTMRVEMEDGTIQEINLDRVRRITFRP